MLLNPEEFSYLGKKDVYFNCHKDYCKMKQIEIHWSHPALRGRSFCLLGNGSLKWSKLDQGRESKSTLVIGSMKTCLISVRLHKQVWD